VLVSGAGLIVSFDEVFLNASTFGLIPVEPLRYGLIDLRNTFFLLCYCLFFFIASLTVQHVRWVKYALWFILILGTLAGLVVLNLPEILSEMGYVPPYDIPFPFDIGIWSAWWSPLLAIPLWIMTFFALAGIVWFTIALWPADISPFAPGKHAWRHRYTLAGILAILITVIFGHWLWREHPLSHGWQIQGALLPDRFIYSFDRLDNFHNQLRHYPFVLLDHVIYLLQYPILAGLIGEHLSFQGGSVGKKSSHSLICRFCSRRKRLVSRFPATTGIPDHTVHHAFLSYPTAGTTSA
jgi:hypothetical protein